jgi:hypothetical protein
MEAKQAADTDPTYPKPKMLTDKPKRILLVMLYELSFAVPKLTIASGRSEELFRYSSSKPYP